MFHKGSTTSRATGRSWVAQTREGFHKAAVRFHKPPGSTHVLQGFYKGCGVKQCVINCGLFLQRWKSVLSLYRLGHGLRQRGLKGFGFVALLRDSVRSRVNAWHYLNYFVLLGGPPQGSTSSTEVHEEEFHEVSTMRFHKSFTLGCARSSIVRPRFGPAASSAKPMHRPDQPP